MEDVAIYLVTSLAAKGGTAKLGTTKTSELVNLGDFFREHIEPELAAPALNERPVIKAACLKYLVTFRLFPLLASPWLSSSDQLASIGTSWTRLGCCRGSGPVGGWRVRRASWSTPTPPTPSSASSPSATGRTPRFPSSPMRTSSPLPRSL